MRRRVLTTFGFGEHARFLGVSLPTFARYAAEHGYDLFVPQASFFEGRGEGRAASWLKIPLLRSLFSAGYEEVLWLDADAVVRRFDRDIFADCTNAPLHMVVHETEDGSVPNCGVWCVRSTFWPYLQSVWKQNGSRRDAGWWEQAAVISVLGGDPDAAKVSVPSGWLWGRLPYEWNPHALDPRGVPQDCRFFHATMVHDRALAMRRMIGHEAT